VERSRARLNDNKSSTRAVRVIARETIPKKAREHKGEDVYAIRTIKYNEKMSRQAFNYDLTRFLRRDSAAFIDVRNGHS